MVVQINKRKKTASKAAVLALSTSLVTAPGVLSPAYAEQMIEPVPVGVEPRHIEVFAGQQYVLDGISQDEHWIEFSSGLFDLGGDGEGNVVLFIPPYAGTYTAYVYEGADGLIDELIITVKSHRNEADTDGDGLVNVQDIVSYLQTNPMINQDGSYDRDDAIEMLSWINSLSAEPNIAPQFLGVDPEEQFLLDIPGLESKYEHHFRLNMRDYFYDEDGNNLSYHIYDVSSEEHAKFRIVNDKLVSTTYDPLATTLDTTDVTVRATDEHGAHTDGQFTFERNRAPQLTELVVDGEVDVEGIYYYYTSPNDGDVSDTVVIKLSDYFVELDGEEMRYYYSDGSNLANFELDEESTELSFKLISGYSNVTVDVIAEDPFGQSVTATFNVTFEQSQVP